MKHFAVRIQSKINKIHQSPDPVQSKSSPMLISDIPQYIFNSVSTRGERILIFQLLIHIRKIFAYANPIFIRKFLKFSIRYTSVSECDTG